MARGARGGRGRSRGGGRGRGRGRPSNGNQERRDLPLDLSDDPANMPYEDDGDSSDDDSDDDKSTRRMKSGKAQYYAQNKHRFDMNYKVLQWQYSDIQTPIPLEPVSDYFNGVKQYCNSFLDFVYEETRASIAQSLDTNSHGDIAKCKIMKWKKGKNKGDAAGINLEIIPRQKENSTLPPYIPLFQKHDYVVITRDPSLANLDKQNHFFAIIEEGNQLSSSKFSQLSQPWMRKQGGRRGKGRRGRGRFTKGSTRRSSPTGPISNLTTTLKAKFYAHQTTKLMMNMEASKGRNKRAGKRLYPSESHHDYWFVIPVYNMVTKHREYESIQRMAVPEFLSETWTKAKKTKVQKTVVPRGDFIAPKLRDHLIQNYNKSQFHAIDEVLNNQEKKVHLIHGPPGSGKTSTLLGLIMCLLANRQRVLICSGTNVAVDHVIAKMAKEGLRNSNGERYELSKNKMARIGNDQKIDELSKEIDPATRFKRLTKIVKDIQNGILAVRNEQFEVMEKSRASKSTFNARNSIVGRSDKMLSLLTQTEQIISQLLTTKLVNQELVDQMHQKYTNVKDEVIAFIELGKQQEVKKMDLNTAAKTAYDHIDQLFSECQRYLAIDNRDVEKKILDNSDLVFATLAITGRQMMRDCKKFNVLIIDEAAQVTESESMIPMDLITDQVVLIGDPHQLPSTVISQAAIEKGYDRSMFERILKIVDEEEKSGRRPGHKPVLLDTQYRMHPHISRYPEHQFYNNMLKDGENVKKYDEHPLWKPRYQAGLDPCLFINCSSKEKFNPTTKSFENEVEADMVVKLIDLYMTKYGISRSEIAVITFYRGQVDLIRAKLAKYDEQKKGQTDTSQTPIEEVVTDTVEPDQLVENEQELNDNTESGDESDEEDEILEEEEEGWYDVNTVDSYQGSEKQVCILSTVRSNDRGFLGFCVDKRRLNVAVTRAQFSLTIIGNGESLCSNDLWKSYVRAVKIVEPEDLPDFTPTPAPDQQQPILLRNILRKNLRFVSAILKNKYIKSQHVDPTLLLNACIETSNHTLLQHLMKQGVISLPESTTHNLLEQSFASRAYSCCTVLLKQKQLLPLVFEQNTEGNLPIHQCSYVYGKASRDQKEDIVKLFETILLAMIQSKKNDAMLIKDSKGNTVPELLIKNGNADLLSILVKHNLLDLNDEHLLSLAKGGRCEVVFETAKLEPQPQPVNQATTTSVTANPADQHRPKRRYVREKQTAESAPHEANKNTRRGKPRKVYVAKDN